MSSVPVSIPVQVAVQVAVPETTRHANDLMKRVSRKTTTREEALDHSREICSRENGTTEKEKFQSWHRALELYYQQSTQVNLAVAASIVRKMNGFRQLILEEAANLGYVNQN